MSIVTISRQIGSCGKEIGELVADRLGYRIIWRELINQAAQRAGAPAVALAMIDEFRLLGICPSPHECEQYIRVVAEVMHETAKNGNVVIVGRAGQVVLADFPGCLHTRIIAPQALRVRRIAERHGVALEAASEQVKASDRYRRDYLKRFHKADWGNPELYDLVINTGRLSVEDAADLICHQVRSTRPAVTNQSDRHTASSERGVKN